MLVALKVSLVVFWLVIAALLISSVQQTDQSCYWQPVVCY